MVVTNLPATRTKVPLETAETLAESFRRRETPPQIAKRIHPTNKAARKRLRHQLWRLAATDPDIAEAISLRARATLMVGLGPMVAALVRRAEHGNVMAIKLAFEASGYHNPKVQHEHSGEVTIKLDMPRPNYEAMGGVIEDAEVVEDS
jgi:hypothetical protein